MILSPGDAIELRLPEGYAYGLVVMCPAAYPPAISFLPSICTESIADPIALLGQGDTITALVPLNIRSETTVRVLKRGLAVPKVRFQVPVRDRTGRVLYAWVWDGNSIQLGDEIETDRLPERKILALEALARLLARSEQSP